MIKGLPKKLQDLRIKYGYSQKRVSEMLKISPSIVSGYETGERTPSIESLMALSDLYHCSIDYLLGKQTATQETLISVDGLTAEQIHALRLLIASMKNL